MARDMAAMAAHMVVPTRCCLPAFGGSRCLYVSFGAGDGGGASSKLQQAQRPSSKRSASQPPAGGVWGSAPHFNLSLISSAVLLSNSQPQPGDGGMASQLVGWLLDHFCFYMPLSDM